MKKNLVLYQLSHATRKEEGGRFPLSFLKIDKKYPNFGKYCPVGVHPLVKFSF